MWVRKLATLKQNAVGMIHVKIILNNKKTE